MLPYVLVILRTAVVGSVISSIAILTIDSLSGDAGFRSRTALMFFLHSIPYCLGISLVTAVIYRILSGTPSGPRVFCSGLGGLIVASLLGNLNIVQPFRYPLFVPVFVGAVLTSIQLIKMGRPEDPESE